MPTKPKLTLKSKGFRTVTHVVPTDDDAVVAFLTVEEQLRQARLRNQPDAVIARLEAERDRTEQTVRDTALIVKMRALPQHEYAKLKAAHPPQDIDHERVREQTDNPKAKATWHTDTFGPAVVAACMVEPETVTLDEAAQLKADWNDEEWSGLVLAAIRANEQATGTAGLVFS